MATSDKVVAARATRNGILLAPTVQSEAKRAAVPFALACAFLMRESGGGHNIFGHDPTICVGWGTVTKPKYGSYKKMRGPTGRGGMQGVGGMQLTWYTYQDRADAYGGCWIPRYNYRVGFETVAADIRRNGLWAGVKAYNGSGPAATAYANAVVSNYHWWQAILAGAKVEEAEKIRATTHKMYAEHYPVDLDAHDDAAHEVALAAHLAGTPQVYFPKSLCFGRKSIQVAKLTLAEMVAFLVAHPQMKAFSGYREGDEGDHHCGFALDMVPPTTDSKGKAIAMAAARDARAHKYPYVEPMTQTWIPGNHHLHVSFRRCP